MTEEIIIDVSNCRNKHDDDCMDMPICNEYGDLMDYQSCEARTLCPYRAERIIDRLKQETDKLRSALEEIRDYINTLSSIDCDFSNTETYLRIQDKINEVLK